MSFRFNVETGGATATSYISVASADEYFDAREDSEYWADLTSASTGTLSATDRKQRLLVQATREVDRTFRFHGQKYYTGMIGSSDYQSLQFPREDCVNDDGDPIIPIEIQEATCEQAMWLTQRNANRRTEGESVTKLPQFSDLSLQYLRPWITRVVSPVGRHPWEGSKY
jgi:hypothetical protein